MPATKKSKKSVTKPAKKMPYKNTFSEIAGHVGGMAANSADWVFGENEGATLADLRSEIEWMLGELEGYIESEAQGEKTLLSSLR